MDFSLYSVKLNKCSKKIYQEKESKYYISSSSCDITLPETSFQKIIKRNKCSLLIASGMLNINNISFTNQKRYISNTNFLNINSHEIKQLTKKFSNSKKIIDDVEKFVFSHIEKKIIGIPMLSALSILKNRSGDCTEHTVLTVAILRALKIPSRAIVGMFLCRQVDGKQNIFIYHMWAEAFYNDRWKLVDSTRPGKKFLNRYIALTYHNLKTETPLEFLKAVCKIKNLTVEYTDN